MIRFLIVLIIGLGGFSTAMANKTVGAPDGPERFMTHYSASDVPYGVVFLQMTLSEKLSSARNTLSTPDTSFDELVDALCTEYRRQKVARSLDAESLASYLQRSDDATYAALEREYEDHYIRLNVAEQRELEEEISEMRKGVTFARTNYMKMAREKPGLFLKVIESRYETLTNSTANN